MSQKSIEMEHADLIQEMPHIEQLATQDRLALARRRRNHQLKLWLQKEKEHNRKPTKLHKSHKRSIQFRDSVVLLEAAARNDIDEGRFMKKFINVFLFVSCFPKKVLGKPTFFFNVL